MEERNPSVLDVLVKALEESDGETTDLTIEHGELPGLTREMMDWWLVNQADSDRYKKWYPKDHVSFKWLVRPTGGNLAGALSLVEERIGEFSASVLRIRPEGPKGWSSISDANDIRVAWFFTEVTETPNGIKMRSLFRLPSKTPKAFLDAMYRHNMEEMALLPSFLPDLYRQATGVIY